MSVRTAVSLQTRPDASQEGGDRLRRRGAVHGHDLLAVLVLDRGPLGGQLERRPHPLLRQADAPRRELGDLLGRPQRALEQPSSADDVGHEPDALRLLAVDAAGR